MGILDWLKKDKWQYVQQGNFNRPIWTTQKDKQFITEGYNRLVWVYACVGAISSAVSSVPWLLYRKGRSGRLIEVTEHPILTMLNSKANPYMSSKDFLDYWATYLAIEGKFFAEYSNPNAPMAMYPIYPHYVHPIPHRTEFISGFEYRLDQPINYLPNELLWSKFNDPLDVYQGQSPIRALSRTIDTENEAVNWNKATLQNAGVPAGVFSIQNPSAELQEKLKEEWKRRYAGGDNARTPLILNSDKASYLPLGLSPVDMDFLNQRQVNRIEICAAFGVPSQIVGDPQGQTYANYGEAQKAFWENTVISRYLDHIREKLQFDLLPRFADNLELRYDLSNVGALKENEDKRSDRIINQFKAGLIKRNEGRYALDYEDDLEKGDLYFNELQAQTPIPSSTPAPTPEQVAPEAGQPETEMPETEIPETEIPETEMPETEDETEIEIEIGDQTESEDMPEDAPTNQQDIINRIADLLNGLKKKEITNFPTAGENETVTLANSSFEVFPLDYAENLRENYPDIWDEGGNIQGNDTYRVLKRIKQEGKSADELTPNDIDIIRMRESWSARHFRDHRLAGVIAQVKWLMVGSRGLDHMKTVIQEAKDKQKKAKEMTYDEQKALWKKIDDQREIIVKKTQREIINLFRSENEKIQKAIKKQSPTESIQTVETIIDEDKKEWKKLLTAMYIATVDEFGTQTYNEQIDKKMMTKAFDPYSDELMYWISVQVANAVTYVTDTTKFDIKEIIMLGISKGWAIGSASVPNTIANAIENLYLEQIIPNRSEVIARTETLTAANEGSLQGAKQTGLNLLKKWLPTFDDSTRESHLAMADNPAIPLDADFNVNGSYGQAPAAPTLSAKERINCRCAIIYERLNKEV